MLKLILFTLFLICPLHADEWLNVNDYPAPLFERIMFYEEISKEVWIASPKNIEVSFFFTYQQKPCITRWTKVPEKPSIDMTDWLPCSIFDLPMHELVIFYDRSTDSVECDIPMEHCIYVGHYLEIIPNITHWKKTPKII